MTETPAYTIFVNSTDSFEDTWVPFFHLLADFWPDPGTVVLNTETQAYVDPRVDVVATQIARAGEGRIPWGECVIRALNHIPTETFIYLQDDYFLRAPVMHDVIEEAVRIVAAEGLDCLRLLECGGTGPFEPTGYPWLCSLAQHARYRLSMQAAIWTKTGIRKYLRSHESGWELEVWGSKRAARIPGRIWAVDRSVYSEEREQVVPYVPTGIVKGQWLREAVEELFAEHGLDVDFSVRGWLPAEGPHTSTLTQKLRKLPAFAWDRIRSL
jgi:hypothetical protein